MVPDGHADLRQSVLGNQGGRVHAQVGHGAVLGQSVRAVTTGAGHGEHGHSNALLYLCLPAALAFLGFGARALIRRTQGRQDSFLVAACLTLTALAFFVGVGAGKLVPEITEHLLPAEESAGHAASHRPLDLSAKPPAEQLVISDPQAASGVSLVAIFFSIYYTMTGIHAIHIIAGMGVIAWILVRAVRGEFSSRYFGPVDYVGLYWHLVDLIWIYLFPLLYLIH